MKKHSTRLQVEWEGDDDEDPTDGDEWSYIIRMGGRDANSTIVVRDFVRGEDDHPIEGSGWLNPVPFREEQS